MHIPNTYLRTFAAHPLLQCDFVKRKNYTASTGKSQILAAPRPGTQILQRKARLDAECVAPAPNQNNTPIPSSDLYRVIGMLFIPPRNQIVAGLADILGIDEFAPKSALLVHCPINALVRLDVDLVLAIQANAEGIDGSAGVDRASVQQQADEGLDLAILHVLDDAARKSGALSDQLHIPVFVGRFALVYARAIGVDCTNTTCHSLIPPVILFLIAADLDQIPQPHALGA